jgi:hypothetical protein
MNVTSRVTRDADLLDPTIPQKIKALSIQFPLAYPDFKLSNDWLNKGPISLQRDLPEGWRADLQKIFAGKAICLSTLGRLDLLKTKLYALCDRGTDFDDCVKLAPSLEGINECLPWVLKGDANPLWPERVNEMITELKKELKINESTLR